MGAGASMEAEEQHLTPDRIAWLMDQACKPQDGADFLADLADESNNKDEVMAAAADTIASLKIAENHHRGHAIEESEHASIDGPEACAAELGRLRVELRDACAEHHEHHSDPTDPSPDFMAWLAAEGSKPHDGADILAALEAASDAPSKDTVMTSVFDEISKLREAENFHRGHALEDEEHDHSDLTARGGHS